MVWAGAGAHARLVVAEVVLDAVDVLAGGRVVVLVLGLADALPHDIVTNIKAARMMAMPVNLFNSVSSR